MNEKEKVRVEIVPISPPEIERSALVKVTTAGNILTINYADSRTTKPAIWKVDNEKYVVLSEDTGEVHYYKKQETRADNIKSLQQTFARLRDVINANTQFPSHCRWVTCTYKENTRDDKAIRNDFTLYIRRLHELYGNFEYVAVREPQGRGAWHLHMILIFPADAPYMDNKKVAECWSQGFTTTKKCDNCDNLGAYLSAYMADMPLEDAQRTGVEILPANIKVVLDEKKGRIKKYVKGARMVLYPPSMNFYTCSRGVKRPVVEMMSYEKAMQKASEGTLTYAKSMMLKSKDFRKTISTTYYNLAKQNNQEKEIRYKQQMDISGSELFQMLHPAGVRR